MKNLANCKPSEFLVQTNKIRKSVERWLTATDIQEIRKRVPKYDDKMSADERIKVRNEQMRANLSAIFDAILEEHPAETLELMALMCFIEPEKADDYPMSAYLQSIGELIADESVLSFFTSLASLGNNGILTLAEK
jgi:hypothetical protein